MTDCNGRALLRWSSSGDLRHDLVVYNLIDDIPRAAGHWHAAHSGPPSSSPLRRPPFRRDRHAPETRSIRQIHVHRGRLRAATPCRRRMRRWRSGVRSSGHHDVPSVYWVIEYR